MQPDFCIGSFVGPWIGSGSSKLLNRPCQPKTSKNLRWWCLDATFSLATMQSFSTVVRSTIWSKVEPACKVSVLSNKNWPYKRADLISGLLISVRVLWLRPANNWPYKRVGLTSVDHSSGLDCTHKSKKHRCLGECACNCIRSWEEEDNEFLARNWAETNKTCGERPNVKTVLSDWDCLIAWDH